MKKLLPTAIVILLVSVFAFIAINKNTSTFPIASTPAPTPMPILSIGETQIKIDIADTSEKKQLGLGQRDSLPADQGMLFLYGTKSPAVFWMKGMRFALDIIWIADGKIVQISEDVPPEPGVADNNLKKYVANELVDSVLEVNAGFVKEHDIKVGDRIHLN